MMRSFLPLPEQSSGPVCYLKTYVALRCHSALQVRKEISSWEKGYPAPLQPGRR